MFVDRPYQTEYVTAAREAVRAGARKIILCAPVGSGKTHCAARIMGLSVANGKRCLFLAPARELVNQCSRKLDDSGIEHGIIMAGRGYNFGAPVQVSCTPSLLSQGVRRGVIDMPPAELIVCDEVHYGGAETDKLLKRYPQAVIVGLSATPAKSDGRGLGGPGGYQRIIQAVKRSELIAQGYITATRVFAPYRPNMKLTKEERERGERPTGSDGDYRSKFSERRMDKPELVGDIVAQWQRLGQGRPTICFACSVDHSRHVCARFLMAGVPAVHLEARSPEEHRRRALDGLADGSVKILCNFGVAVSGIDVPAVGTIILARPTKSLIVWTQAVGRGVRCYSGPLYAKDKAILIDHCLDSETEILTRRGFVGRCVISDDDQVAAMDANTGEISWQPILSRVDRQLDDSEDIYRAAGKSADIRVTGNHRIVYKKRICDSHGNVSWPTAWSIDTADHMATHQSRFKIPVSGVQIEDGLPLTDDELRFIGWFVTDGSMGRSAVYISQAAHQPQIVDLESCLAGCGFDYLKHKRKTKGLSDRPQLIFQIPKGTCKARPRSGWNRLAQYLDKELSPSLEGINERQFEVLLHAIHLGDGSKDRLPNSYRITTGNKTFADRLQSLCVRRGFRCSITVCQPRGPITKKIRYTLNIKKTGFLIIHGARPAGGQAALVKSVAIPGEQVWCVSNPLGTLITRRRGKVAVVGNSGCWQVHGRPDDDIEWELSPDRKVQDKVRKENEDAPRQVKCKFCHAVFDYRPTCPNCGRPVERPRKGKEIKENKAGVLVEIPDGHPQADAMKLQQYTRLWHRCLAGASARDGTVYEAVARFKKESGVWPTAVGGLVNVPRSQEELYDKVRRVYPGYHDPDARPPRKKTT